MDPFAVNVLVSPEQITLCALVILTSGKAFTITVLTAVGGALVAAPVALPAAVVTIAGYMAVAGTVATAVSQVTVKNERRFIDEGNKLTEQKK
jgi:hypothetical protein